MDIKLFGIAQGTALTLSASVGAITVTQPVAAWAGTGSGGGGGGGGDAVPDLIQYSHKANLEVAPYAAAFKPDLDAVGALFGIAAPAGVTYDARLHDPVYIWNYGENYTYTAPQHYLYNQSGTSIGPIGVHVFRTPGTHNVRLDVYGFLDGELVHAYGERQIVVADGGSTVFSGNRTMFISPSSDWTHAPAGSVKVTTLAQAMKAANGAGDAPAGSPAPDNQPMRIMFNRGETHNVTQHGIGFNTQWVKSIHFVPGPGTGALPIINITAGENHFFFNCNTVERKELYKTLDFVVQGFDMRGPFDSSVYEFPPYIPYGFAISGTSPNTVLIDQCSTDGYSSGLGVSSGTVEEAHHRGVFLNDWAIQNYSSNCVSGYVMKHFSATGCRFMSHPDSYIDNAGAGGWGFRIEDYGKVAIVDACDFFIRQGWSGADGIIAEQACLRLGDGRAGGQTIQITRSTFEGGYSPISLMETNYNSLPGNTIVDSNYMLGNYQSKGLMIIKHGGVTIRNNTFVLPDAVRIAGYGVPNQFIVLEERIKDSTPNAENSAAPIDVYNNTFIDMIGGIPLVKNQGFTNYTAQNNVTNIADGPLVQSPVLWLPRSKGYKTSTQSNPETFTPADVVWPANPAMGSPAIGSATGALVPYLDMLGNVRPASASRGALEPDFT